MIQCHERFTWTDVRRTDEKQPTDDSPRNLLLMWLTVIGMAVVWLASFSWLILRWRTGQLSKTKGITAGVYLVVGIVLLALFTWVALPDSSCEELKSFTPELLADAETAERDAAQLREENDTLGVIYYLAKARKIRQLASQIEELECR